MTKPSLIYVLLLMAACSSTAGGSHPSTGGTGGDEEGGQGGGPATGGKGGSPVKPDAAAPEKDSGAADSAGPDSGPATADCTAAGAGSIFCNTTGPLPKTIKETGLFPGAPDFSKRPASLREYVPDPPLWSDGLEKQRFLLLPQGTKIDNRDGKRWDFPIGTVFIKTFFDDGGAGHRPIETRIIRRIGGPDAFDQYEYAVYKWNPEGTDAELLDLEAGRTPVMITIKSLGAPFTHLIPDRPDCEQCHASNGKVAQTFIGFDELRLNSPGPTGAGKQLQDMAALFTQAPPAKPAEIADADARMLRIKRFAFGNCVHCHNGGRLFDLHPEMLVANTVGKMADASGIAPPAGWLRVVPGKPEMSILFVETRATALPTGLKAMPPVGVAVPQAESVTDLKAWIMSLPAK
jgi:hypothetical protein